MSIKTRLKRILPRSFHHIYNRFVSRHIIHKKVGKWFDVDWKRKAAAADSREWMKVYDESWRNWNEQDLAPEDIVRIEERIFADVTLLDAGCGDGYLLEAIRTSRSRHPARASRNFGMAGTKTVAVDLSKVALIQAKRRLGNSTPLVQTFIEDLPFSDNTFDVVISAHTLEHVRDLKRAVSELKRVAARRLIVLVPSQEYLPYTEDYHLHFFSCTDDLIRAIGVKDAECVRYENPSGSHKYGGDVLLLTADLE